MVLADPGVDQAFDASDLVRLDRTGHVEVEAQAAGLHKGPLLSHAVTQHGFQGGLQQVGSGVVGGGRRAARDVNCRRDLQGMLARAGGGGGGGWW